MLIGLVSFFSSPGTVQAIEKSYVVNSPHPYTNNYTNTWTISESGATRIRVYFETIDTESGYDFVRTDAGDSWSGVRSGVWSSWKTGSSIKVTLSTDYSVTDWGFRITKIDYEKSGVTGGFTNTSTTNSGFNRTAAKNYLTQYTKTPEQPVLLFRRHWRRLYQLHVAGTSGRGHGFYAYCPDGTVQSNHLRLVLF